MERTQTECANQLLLVSSEKKLELLRSFDRRLTSSSVAYALKLRWQCVTLASRVVACVCRTKELDVLAGSALSAPLEASITQNCRDQNGFH